jgi:protein-S-isoprenylcysteine O-methyltransferase Ste14
MNNMISEFFSHLFTILVAPLPFVLWPIPFALPFWAVYAWSRRGERKVLVKGQAADAKAVADHGSWRVIDYGSKAARLAALAVAFVTPPWVAGAERLWLYGLGLLAMLTGALIRRHCFKALGDYFTFEVKVTDRQTVIRHGLYRYVRHPSYTGGMLFNLGIGLALTNAFSTVFLGLGMALVYVYRVRVEEAALLRARGAEYGEYMRRTKRFIPFVF